MTTEEVGCLRSDVGRQKAERELVPAISNLIFVRSTQERVTLRDHIILADEQYFSFKDNKKL